MSARSTPSTSVRPSGCSPVALDSSAASRRAGGIGDVAWSAVGAGGAAGAPALARASSGCAEAPFFRSTPSSRPRGAGPASLAGTLGGGPPPLRAVRDGGGRAENDDNPPKHLFERLGEREAHGAVQHPAQDAPLVSAAPSTLAGCGRRGGFGRAAAHEQAPARSVKCSWRAAARHVSLCWGLLA